MFWLIVASQMLPLIGALTTSPQPEFDEFGVVVHHGALISRLPSVSVVEILKGRKAEAGGGNTDCYKNSLRILGRRA